MPRRYFRSKKRYLFRNPDTRSDFPYPQPSSKQNQGHLTQAGQREHQVLPSIEAEPLDLVTDGSAHRIMFTDSSDEMNIDELQVSPIK